jgi:hypothetical protein
MPVPQDREQGGIRLPAGILRRVLIVRRRHGDAGMDRRLGVGVQAVAERGEPLVALWSRTESDRPARAGAAPIRGWRRGSGGPWCYRAWPRRC